MNNPKNNKRTNLQKKRFIIRMFSSQFSPVYSLLIICSISILILAMFANNVYAKSEITSNIVNLEGKYFDEVSKDQNVNKNNVLVNNESNQSNKTELTISNLNKEKSIEQKKEIIIDELNKKLPLSEIKRLEKFDLEKIQNMNIKEVSVKNLIQKREISQEKIIQIEKNYKNTLEKLNELDSNYSNLGKKIKNSINEEKNCKDDCETIQNQTSNLVKNQISNMIQLMKESLNKISLKVMENKAISEEDVLSINKKIDELNIELNNLNQQTNKIISKEDLKAHYKSIVSFSNNARVELKKDLSVLSSSRYNSIIVHMNVLERKLFDFKEKNFIDDEIPSDVEEKINTFSEIISQAKNLYELDNDLSQEEMKLIDEKLKEANTYLVKEILPMLRNNGVKNVEDILKVDENETLTIVEEN
jgi:plasmid maintenance system antidote protein VapI